MKKYSLLQNCSLRRLFFFLTLCDDRHGYIYFTLYYINSILSKGLFAFKTRTNTVPLCVEIHIKCNSKERKNASVFWSTKLFQCHQTETNKQTK